MKTDMTFTEMKSFLSYLSKGAPRIDSLTLDGTDDTSTGIYYYQLNQDSVEETKEIFKNHLGQNEQSSSLTSGNTGTDSAASSDDNSAIE